MGNEIFLFLCVYTLSILYIIYTVDIYAYRLYMLYVVLCKYRLYIPIFNCVYIIYIYSTCLCSFKLYI